MAIAGDGGVKVWESNNWDDDPFRLEMTAAATKIAWSGAVPLLAVSCRGEIAIWKKAKSPGKNWNSHVLEFNENLIQDLQFQPQSLLLASCSENGYLFLWDKAQKLIQNLTGVKGGFSCLKWNKTGNKLAAGGDNGEIVIFRQSQRGQSFG